MLQGVNYHKSGLFSLAQVRRVLALLINYLQRWCDKVRYPKRLQNVFISLINQACWWMIWMGLLIFNNPMRVLLVKCELGKSAEKILIYWTLFIMRNPPFLSVVRLSLVHLVKKSCAQCQSILTDRLFYLYPIQLLVQKQTLPIFMSGAREKR